MNIDKLYDSGIQLLADEHDAKEVSKLGILRAGNTGLLLEGKRVIGTCARLTLLRLKGVPGEEISHSKRLMFDAGLSNEDIWAKSLEAGIRASGQSLVVKREEEIPISWLTPSGVTVTGRPDLVIGEMRGEQFLPKVGLELKLVSSVWTARDTGLLLEPKLVHLMQAGHYAWQLGIPFQLWYTNRAEFAVGSGWEQKTIPAEKDLLTPVVEYSDKVDQRKNQVIRVAKKILQYRQGFEIEWTKGKQLKYRPILADTEGRELEWTWTPITQQGIIDYYEAVVKQEKEKKLAARPLNLKSDGSPGNFSSCDYCPLKASCESHETDYDKWLDAVSNQVK